MAELPSEVSLIVLADTVGGSRISVSTFAKDISSETGPTLPFAPRPGMLKDANDRLALMQKLQRDPLQGRTVVLYSKGIVWWDGIPLNQRTCTSCIKTLFGCESNRTAGCSIL